MSSENYEANGYGHNVDLSHTNRVIPCPTRSGCVEKSYHLRHVYLTLPLFCTVELVTIIYTSSITRMVENVYITGSAFMVGRFATAVLWGMAADKYGRKPIIIIGVGSVCV